MRSRSRGQPYIDRARSRLGLARTEQGAGFLSFSAGARCANRHHRVARVTGSGEAQPDTRDQGPPLAGTECSRKLSAIGAGTPGQCPCARPSCQFGCSVARRSCPDLSSAVHLEAGVCGRSGASVQLCVHSGVAERLVTQSGPRPPGAAPSGSGPRDRTHAGRRLAQRVPRVSRRIVLQRIIGGSSWRCPVRRAGNTVAGFP